MDGMEQQYFILGCTACGKGRVGRVLAKRLGANILSVDSMKVYRRMDIGTAKPTAEHRAEIPHFGLDLVEPSESFSVAKYVDHAREAMRTIRQNGAIPLAVGGTSLYIQALSEGLFEAPGASPELRTQLRHRAEQEGSLALHEELREVDPESAGRIHPNDTRRIIRAMEVYQTTGQPISELQTQWNQAGPKPGCVRIGLRRPKDTQSHRINERVGRMMDRGLLREVEALLAEPHPLSREASRAVGYAELIDFFEGRWPLDKAVEKIKINTRRLAKKQRTWHRRWRDVQWFDIPDDESPDATAERILREVDFR